MVYDLALRATNRSATARAKILLATEICLPQAAADLLSIS
jgi:hypothetical protein